MSLFILEIFSRSEIEINVLGYHKITEPGKDMWNPVKLYFFKVEFKRIYDGVEAEDET